MFRHMSGPTFIPLLQDKLYKAMIAKLRARRLQLGLSQEDVNAAAGLTDGHIGKLESQARTASLPTLALWAQTLGLEVAFSPATLPRATQRALQARESKPYDRSKAKFKHAS